STSTPVTLPRSAWMPTTRVCWRIVAPRARAPAASAWASPEGSSQPSVGSHTAPRTPSTDISGKRSWASFAEMSSSGSPNVLAQPPADVDRPRPLAHRGSVAAPRLRPFARPHDGYAPREADGGTSGGRHATVGVRTADDPSDAATRPRVAAARLGLGGANPRV